MHHQESIPLYVQIPQSYLENLTRKGERKIATQRPAFLAGQRYVIKTEGGGSQLAKANSSSEIEFIPSNRKYGIAPADVRQRLALDAIYDPNIQLAVLLGPSGTGKSCLPIMSAINGVETGQYDRIVIIRSLETVVQSRNWGALPGSKDEKLSPYLESIWDVADSMKKGAVVNEMLEKDLIEMLPIELVRGRDFNKCFVILEEAQNLGDHALRAVGTRIGKTAKLVINGDLNQVDNQREIPGLYKLLQFNGFWESELTFYMNLTKRMRSPLCELIEQALGGDPDSCLPVVVEGDLVLSC